MSREIVGPLQMLLISLVIAAQKPRKFTQPCALAFEGFIGHFRKEYSNTQERQEAYEQFCRNYARLVELDREANVDITEFMDQDFESLVQPDSIMNFDPTDKQNSTLCYSSCLAKNPLPNLAEIPQSADLREMGLVTDAKRQGKCGSCWAFSAVSLLETAMLHDKAKIQKDSKFWADQFKRGLNLSEQFVISNDMSGKDHYCKGGQIFHAMNNLAYNASTVETQENFPYMPKENGNLERWQNLTKVLPKLQKADHYLPFKIFEDQFVSQARTPVVKLYNSPKKFDETAINTIKSYLARGISIGFYMKVMPKDPFYFFKGGKMAHQECKPFKVNHAVTAIGYGRKYGEMCWIVKNSWGTRWGDNGVFYVPIGKDSYCIEHNAYAIIPKYLEVEDGVPPQERKRSESWQLDEDLVVTAADVVIKGAGWAIALGCVTGLIVIAAGAYGTHVLFKRYKQPLIGPEEKLYKSEM